MVAVDDSQVGWVTTAAVPMLSSAEATWTLSNITSTKLVKWFHPEAEEYELLLPHGIYTGMLLCTSVNTLERIEHATVGLAVTEVRLQQSSNAQSPIDVTELGMVNEVSPRQPRNAKLPIEVTELGMVVF